MTDGAFYASSLHTIVSWNTTLMFVMVILGFLSCMPHVSGMECWVKAILPNLALG